MADHVFTDPIISNPTLQSVTALFSTMQEKQLSPVEKFQPKTEAQKIVVQSNMRTILSYCEAVGRVMDSDQCKNLPELQRQAYKIYATQLYETAIYVGEKLCGRVGPSPREHGLYMPDYSPHESELAQELNSLRLQMRIVSIKLWNISSKLGRDPVLQDFTLMNEMEASIEDECLEEITDSRDEITDSRDEEPLVKTDIGKRKEPDGST